LFVQEKFMSEASFGIPELGPTPELLPGSACLVEAFNVVAADNARMAEVLGDFVVSGNMDSDAHLACDCGANGCGIRRVNDWHFDGQDYPAQEIEGLDDLECGRGVVLDEFWM
jgi:hypothetical protein